MNTNESHFYIFRLSYKLTSQDPWPSFWPLPIWTCEGSCIISINHVWFQSNFTISIEVIFFFLGQSYNLTTWPLMTYDFDIWPLTTRTFKGSHIVFIYHVWFQSDFNFSKEATFTFSAYPHFLTWPQIWPLTLMWPFDWNPSNHVKVRAKCYPFSLQQTTTDNSTKWSLCVSLAEAGNTKLITYIYKYVNTFPPNKVNKSIIFCIK